MSEVFPSPSAQSAQTAFQRLPVSELRTKALELEGVFLNTLMSQMFSSIDSEGTFGGGFAEETWRSMQSEQYANAMAEAGGIGLADQIVRQLLQQQEAILPSANNMTALESYRQ